MSATEAAQASGSEKTDIRSFEVGFPDDARNNRLDRGGHFAAWEQPELFCDEMRAAFRPLR